MQKTIDIKQDSIETLKAAAYDYYIQIQQLQNNLNILNQEISERQQKELETNR